MMMNLDSLGAREAAAAIAEGRASAESLMEGCLARVRERESQVEAWAWIEPEHALAEARGRDREKPKGPLHGLPIGVKDVIDTHDMPTEYGSPIYAGHRPAWDAACVALVREQGGVIMGKTVTTEFATRHPGKSRNPRNLAHTPGGSSSGSAAAVADLMVPLAFGTQTTGSLIRPAAYCGIVGYKPSFGTINRTGLKPLSDSQDTIGVHARSVPDAAFLVAAISARAMPDFDGGGRAPPRIGLCRTHEWPHADDATRGALEDGASRLSRAGATVVEIALDEAFRAAMPAQDVINEFETWRALAYERTNHAELLSPALTERLARSGRHSRADYEEAQAVAQRCRGLLKEVFAEVDVLLAPSAPGEAPRGLESTGNPIFSQLWTLMHVPCVTVPVFEGPAGLPMGAQLIGPYGADERALLAAEWVHRSLSA